MEGHTTREMEGVEVKLNGNPPVVHQPQNACDIQPQHAEGRKDAPKSTKKKLLIVIISSIAFLLVVGGVMTSRFGANARSAVSASAVASPNIDCAEAVQTDDTLSTVSKNISSLSKSGKRRHLREGATGVFTKSAKAAEAIARNDGMLDTSTVRFHIVWIHSAFYISSIKIVGPHVLFVLLSIHNNQWQISTSAELQKNISKSAKSKNGARADTASVNDGVKCATQDVESSESAKLSKSAKSSSLLKPASLTNTANPEFLPKTSKSAKHQAMHPLDASAKKKNRGGWR